VSADFQISLPNWPMARVLKEACAIWNTMHPDDRAYPEESEWPLLYNAVMTFLRHQHTDYDAALAAGADRDELREQIARAAGRAYRWLRIEHDSRSSVQAKTERKDFRIFNDFSKRLSDLVSIRARLTLATKDARHHRAPGWRKDVAELEERLGRVNAKVDELTDLFKPFKLDEHRELHTLAMLHRTPGYDFAGRGELAPSYTKSAGFRCESCGRIVMRSKCPLPVGAGKRQVAFSCFCKSLLIDPQFVHGIRLGSWQMLGKDQPERFATNIVVMDEDCVLYGHQLLKEIAEGRKEAQEVRFFHGVRLEAFYALLMVRFREVECIKALGESDEITDEQLERISAELILTAGDIEALLEAQERMERGG
jgi:hypothetical protein